MEYYIVCYEEIDSTNLEAKRLSSEGAKEGLVVLSKKQTAGRGRRGRTWESPAGENLYFSILLKPSIRTEQASMLTIIMAYSVARVLMEERLPVQIKWPNDLVLSKKKVCGILTEMYMDGCQIEDIVVGVGININTTCFPEELRDKATSIYLETGKCMRQEELLQKVLAEFQVQYEMFLQTGDLSLVKDFYNQMLVNRNQEVMILEPNSEYEGIALGINDVGELLVEKSDGKIEKVFSGEVSVRGLYRYV